MSKEIEAIDIQENFINCFKELLTKTNYNIMQVNITKNMAQEIVNLYEQYKKSKPSEALKCVNELWQDINVENDFRNDFERLKTIEQALLELQSIKESNPNEVLKILEEVKYAPSFMGGNDRYRTYLGSDKLYEKDINIIKQYILKAQENEKVLEIIKDKNVLIYNLKIADNLTEYNRWADDENTLTQEEFELLKRYFENGRN